MWRLLLAGLGMVLASAPGRARAADLFFLMLAGEPPDQALVQSAHREALRESGVLEAEAGRAVLGRAFPRLFGARPPSDRSLVEGDLKVARAAHLSGRFQDAENALARAIDAVFAQPELLTGQPELAQRLVDAAALRFTNNAVLQKSAASSRVQVEAFARRFPFLVPTFAEHPPAVHEAWANARAAVGVQASPLAVNVHPLDLERGGGCLLFLNGVEVAALPMPGPVQVPAGDHHLQVRCGVQSSWLMRLTLDGRPRTLRVPVRAMMAARGDAQTGGIVLVDPGERDSAVLVDAVSDAANLEGAAVARTATAKVEFGRWNAGMSGPTVESVGSIDGATIVSVRRAGGESAGGRVWTWVAGGLGLGALTAGVVTNVMYESDRQAGKPQSELDGLQTASTVLYVAGGALLVTSVILFFAEDEPTPPTQAFRSPAPGAVVWRY